MPDPADRSPPRLDRAWLSRVRETLAAGTGLIVCLDFDGTLAPIVEDPDDATITPTNRQLLRELADSPAVTVAVVSGRSLADLRERVDVDGVHYAGNHGLEWDGADGRAVADAAEDGPGPLRDTVEHLRSQLADVPGCTIEDKELTATVHYRRVPEPAVPTVIETTASIVESTDGLEYRSGKQILDVRPDGPSGKDRIVDRLRERRPDAAIVVVGDDVTDEDAFRAAEPDGFAVLVGDDRETAASVRVPDVDGVTQLLAWLVAAVADQPAQPTS